MSELHLPWLELAILCPLLGCMSVGRMRDPDRARLHSLFFSGATLVFTIGVLIDFGMLRSFVAHDHWDLLQGVFHRDVFVIDELSAPLLPLVALLFLLTQLATLRTKVRRFSFALTLLSESILIATLTSALPWMVVALLAAGVIPPYIELRRREKPTRVYELHMSAFVILLIAGQLCSDIANNSTLACAAILMTSAAVLIRNGVVPVHCWMRDLFENASFGTALLFVTPMAGAFGAMRLVLPVAPHWVMDGIAVISLVTAVYAAGMSLVQTEARRFFAYVCLSNSSFILVGFGMLGTQSIAPIGLTGALCVWLSVGISLTGFGLTLRSLEARCGRLSLAEYHGLYEKAPILAAFFLLTGLASIGFPGTIGFIGTELLIDAAVQASPWIGLWLVVASALNGLAVLHAYFRVFTGRRHAGTIDLHARTSERMAVLTLTLLILGGGIYPQPGVASRYHAADELTAAREQLFQKSNGAETQEQFARSFDGEEEDSDADYDQAGLKSGHVDDDLDAASSLETPFRHRNSIWEGD